MANKRIAIACEGGGSQCAFVAGALKTLFGRGVQDRYRIVGLSGTSGRNDLAGNLSLQHELQVIDMVNLLLQEGALTPAFRARFGVDTTERITVRFIRMSQELPGRPS